MLMFWKKLRGFTLIEMILTIIIIGIIAGVTAKILMTGLDTYSFIANRKDATQHARVAMERMVSELTLLESDDITYISNERLKFIDRDDAAASFQKVIVSGNPTLYRSQDFLAGRLGFIDFDYMREDGSAALFAWQVRRINIELSVEALGGYGSIILRTDVFPRNFMYDNFR